MVNGFTILALSKRVTRSDTRKAGERAAHKILNIVELQEMVLSYFAPADLATALLVSRFWHTVIRTSVSLKAPLYLYDLLPSICTTATFRSSITRGIPSQVSMVGYWTMHFQAPWIIDGTKHAAMFIKYSTTIPDRRTYDRWLSSSSKTSKRFKAKEILRPGLMLDSVRLKKACEPLVVWLQTLERKKVAWPGVRLLLAGSSSIGDLLRQVDAKMEQLLANGFTEEEL